QPPPPRDVKADTAPPGGQADTRAPATGQRRAAELGPPSITPAPRPPNVLPERPDAKADFRPDKTASDPGLAHNEPPKVEIAPWAPPRSASQPPGESPAPLVSTQPDFGPTRVPSCILTGETLHNFALNDLSGQPWEFRSHRGRVVLIDFWGTWCLPCLQSIPHLRILQDRYGPYGL